MLHLAWRLAPQRQTRAGSQTASASQPGTPPLAHRSFAPMARARACDAAAQNGAICAGGWCPEPQCRRNRDTARRRHMDMRSLVNCVIVLALLVAGCSSGGHISSRRPQGVATQPTANPHTTLRATSRHSSAPMSARVVLPSRTMTAGSSMSGRVVVENSTGHAIHVTGCVTLFQVVLVNNKYKPTVAWFTCLQKFTIPVGESSYPATVEASYSRCGPGRPRGGLRACLPNNHPPPLPPGDYHAVLFQAVHVVPVPSAETIRVTPPESSP